MNRSLGAAIACLGASAASLLCMEACRATRTPDGTIIIEPAPGTKPIEIPPEWVVQVEINGQCYYKFPGRNGVDYCIPCDMEGSHYVKPCSVIEQQESITYSPEDEASFHEFMAQLIEEANIDETSEDIIEYFDLRDWQAGDDAPVPMALSVLDTDEDFLQVVIIARSDWEWPDNRATAVECIAFPDASGYIPDPTDATGCGRFRGRLPIGNCADDPRRRVNSWTRSNCGRS